MNYYFFIYFFLTYIISKASFQKLQYQNEIDTFLSKWNTSFIGNLIFNNSNRYEDIESIFGPYNEPPVTNNTDTEIYYIDDSTDKSEKAPIYKISIPNVCESDIVIQHSTFLLEDINFLLPYRSVVFISCKSNKLPDISIRHGIYYTKLEGKEYKAYIINSVDMLPGTVFVVNNRTVLIDTLESTAQIISSSNIYLNIANKKNFFDPLQFSYNSSIMQNATRLYSNSLPFSQTFFTQIYSMGTLLNTSKIPTEEDRELSASFNDLIYCSEDRQCNGTYFIGKNDTPFSFLREDTLENVYNPIFDFVTSDMDQYRYRQLVSQRSQYERGVIETGITFNEKTVFISETENNFIKADVQKELSHALGHTYNLSDNSGPAHINAKSMNYYLDFSLNIISPFDNDTKYQYTGAMNGAFLNEDLYPRFNIFSTKKIYEAMKYSSFIPSKIQHSLSNGGSTLFIVNRFKDYFLFKTNIDILKAVNVSKIKCNDCETEIEVYKTMEKRNPAIFYLNTDKPQKIPDEWLNSSNFIIVRNSFLEKLFYLPNEAKEMILPVAGIVPESFKLIPAYRKGVKQVEPRTNNFWLLNSIPKKNIVTQEPGKEPYRETVEDYKNYFVNTSYILFYIENTSWKSVIYVPDILMNETKIIYFYTNSDFDTIISYKNSPNTYNNFTFSISVMKPNAFILTYKNGTWNNKSAYFSYSDVNTTDLFINKVIPHNIVYINVTSEYNDIELPSSNKFDTLIVVLFTIKDIFVKLIIDYNEKNILLKAGRNFLTYVKTGWATVNPNTNIHC